MQNQLLLNQPQSDKEYMELINKVTKEDVVKMANQAYLDTIYVLTKRSIIVQEQYYELIDERVYKHELNNGLRLFVIPKRISKTYVTYTTQFGSLDNTFKPHHKDQYVTVPDGVAHF